MMLNDVIAIVRALHTAWPDLEIHWYTWWNETVSNALRLLRALAVGDRLRAELAERTLLADLECGPSELRELLLGKRAA